MKTVRFGKTGLKVSKLCLGTMTLGSRDWKPWALDEAESKPILKQALDCGFTFFDMADWYSTGENERVVASTLTSMVPRDQLVLTTKAMYPMSDDPNDRGLSRKHLMSSIDGSLDRMGTDYVDIFMVHAFDPDTPIEETMEALHDIVRAGKARYLGASTMYAWQFAQMNAIARENGWTTFINMHCGGNMRIIALIDDVDVLERILKHLKVWDPQPDTLTPAGPDPPLPQGETLSLTYHPVPDIA